MEIEIIRKKNLPLLSIEAAEELQRLKLKKETNLEHAKELSTLIKKDFIERVDYSEIFSRAYFATYSSDLPSSLDKRIPYVEEISKKLETPSNLKYKELEKLVDFCVNLSNYSAFHEEDIRILKSGGCFI
jgi:hypothetical protein